MNNAADLFALFERLNIASETLEHLPVMTANDMGGIDRTQLEFPVKNIFAYDKKKNFYLITMHLDTPPLDLRKLSKQIGASGSLSFVRAEVLGEKLRVLPGSVTPFAIFYDTEKTVQPVLDARLQQAKTISAHPLTNDKTTTISTDDLNKLYAHTGHAPIWADMPVKALD